MLQIKIAELEAQLKVAHAELASVTEKLGTVCAGFGIHGDVSLEQLKLDIARFHANAKAGENKPL